MSGNLQCSGGIMCLQRGNDVQIRFDPVVEFSRPLAEPVGRFFERRRMVGKPCAQCIGLGAGSLKRLGGGVEVVGQSLIGCRQVDGDARGGVTARQPADTGSQQPRDRSVAARGGHGRFHRFAQRMAGGDQNSRCNQGWRGDKKQRRKCWLEA